MDFSQYLLENDSNHTLVIVDIQPAYESYISFDMYDFCQMLNESDYHNILYLYNGPDLGFENFDEIKYWLYEHELNEDVGENMVGFEKNYAFFRDLMDAGYSDEALSLGKYMLKNDITDSRGIDDEIIDELVGDEEELANNLKTGGYSMHMPDVMEILEKIRNPIFVGGGEEECLSEVLLGMKMLEKPYSVNREWIYWQTVKNKNHLL